MGIWGEEIEKWYHLVLSGKFVANTLPPLVSTWDLKTSKIGSFKNYVAEHIVRLLNAMNLEKKKDKGCNQHHSMSTFITLYRSLCHNFGN